MQIEQKQNRIYKPQSNTTLSAEETNQVTTELENVIRAGNLTPNAGTLTQVRDAIKNVVDTAANELQEQIDAITSASDVFDVVGTYAQLQAYDTSTVPVNDIIKVLQDETRNNAMTYYRWNGTSWVFIGAEGPYYTVSEVDQTFATKAQLPGIATTSQVGLVKPDGQSVTVAQDGTLSVASNVAASLPLFTSIWADHILNNASYLRADTFSWQSGSVYTSAYNHLVADISGITAETETISGTTITFYRANDGHKIVLADQESNVATIFNATGIAWYYLLDTVNTRFKLPRSKWNFVGLRTNAGDYVAESLPNITGELNGSTFQESVSGAFTSTNYSTYGTSTGSLKYNNTTFDASRSSSTYQNDAPVQQRATQMYLYFYVGNTVQDQTTVDVGEITDALNNKVDLPANKSQSDVDYVVESYQNGTSWYRVYKSGWCEQGGYVNNNTNYVEIAFLKQFADTNYSIQATAGFDSGFTPTAWVFPSNKSTTSVRIAAERWSSANYTAAVSSFYWEAKGYIL